MKNFPAGLPKNDSITDDFHTNLIHPDEKALRFKYQQSKIVRSPCEIQ